MQVVNHCRALRRVKMTSRFGITRALAWHFATGRVAKMKKPRSREPRLLVDGNPHATPLLTARPYVSAQIRCKTFFPWCVAAGENGFG